MAPRKYMYLSLPYAHTAPVFGRMVPMPLYCTLEAFFKGKNCPADRLQLINGVVAYRVLKQYMYKFKQDGKGYYIDLMTKGLWYFSETDPATTAKPVTSVKEWMPA